MPLIPFAAIFFLLYALSVTASISASLRPQFTFDLFTRLSERQACYADTAACYWNPITGRCLNRSPGRWKSDPVFRHTASQGGADDCSVLASRIARAGTRPFVGCDLPSDLAHARDRHDCKLTARQVTLYDCHSWSGTVIPDSACPYVVSSLAYAHEDTNSIHNVCCLIRVNHPRICLSLNNYDRHFCARWAARNSFPPPPPLNRFATGRISSYEIEEYV